MKSAGLLRRGGTPTVYTIARVASQDANGASGTGSASAVYPASPNAGNLLIASVQGQTAATTPITIPGWRQPVDACQVGVNGTTRQLAILYRVCQPGDSATVTATVPSGTTCRLNIYEYTGLSATPEDQESTAGTGNNSATNVTTRGTGTITTTAARELLFVVCGTSGAVTGPSWDSGFNLRQVNTTLASVFDGDQIVSSTGTYSSTATWTTARAASALIASFKSA